MKMTEIWSKKQEGGKGMRKQEGRVYKALGAEGGGSVDRETTDRLPD